MVKVLVGNERKVYNFHKTLLISSCPFFAKCLNPSFPEGLDNEVVLEGESTETFNCLFGWIYLQRIDTDRQIPFGAVYVLADKFCMERLKNEVVDAAIKYCDTNPVPLAELTQLVSHDLSNSPLGRAFREQLAFDIAENYCSDYAEDEKNLRSFSNLLGDTKVMERFLLDLDKAMISKVKGELKRPSEASTCSFHEHRETPRCEVVERNES